MCDGGMIVMSWASELLAQLRLCCKQKSEKCRTSNLKVYVIILVAEDSEAKCSNRELNREYNP